MSAPSGVTRSLVLVITAAAVVAAACLGFASRAAAVDLQTYAGPGHAPPTKLFTQDADRGSLVPAGERPGEYWLTLRGVKTETLWFHNRPGNRQGTISNRRTLKLLFGKRGEPPTNAAIDAWDPVRRDDVVMGVVLLSGKWNAAKRVLRYRVRQIGAGRAQPRSRDAEAIDVTLPRHFEEAGVFIDEICTARECAAPSEVSQAGEPISKVFIQDAARGTFTPTGKRGGEYLLTLRGVKPRTLWFQGKPGTVAGTVPNQQALDPFFSEPGEAPPNAAIDAWDPVRRDDVVLGVKILDGRWNPEKRILRYRVRRLGRSGSGAAPGSNPLEVKLPRHFEQAGLFVDDCGSACGYLLIDIVRLGQYLDEFFEHRNTCTGIIENLTAPFESDTPPSDSPVGKLWWWDDDYYRYDSWETMPPRVIPFGDPFYPSRNLVMAGWTTVSAWARGCKNNVRYGGIEGTVRVFSESPYSGDNYYRCDVTGNLRCFDDTRSERRGRAIVYYCVMAPRWRTWDCKYEDEP